MTLVITRHHEVGFGPRWVELSRKLPCLVLQVPQEIPSQKSNKKTPYKNKSLMPLGGINGVRFIPPAVFPASLNAPKWSSQKDKLEA